MHLFEYIKNIISIIIVSLRHVNDNSMIHPIYLRKAKQGEYLGAAAQEVIRAYKDDIHYFIQDVCHYLNIDVPPVLFVPYVYICKNKTCGCYYFQNKAQDAFAGVLLTESESGNSMILISVFQDVIIREGELCPYSEIELLYIVAHELRHYWQRKNGYGKEDDTDPVPYIMKAREIDADAFAAFYLYAFFGEHLYLNAFSNDEARKKRIIHIATMYNLNDKNL